MDRQEPTQRRDRFLTTFVAVVFMIGLSGVATAAERPAVVSNLIDSARRDIDSGHFREADAKARAALEQAPESRRAIVRICAGSAALEMGDYERAETLLGAGLDELRTSTGGMEWLMRGTINQSRLESVHGNFEAADARLREVLTLAESNDAITARALMAMGENCISTGRYEEAESLFRRALTIREALCEHERPEVAQALRRIGVVRGLVGDYATAEALVAESERIDSNPANDTPLFVDYDRQALVRFRIDQGHYREAIELSETVIADVRQRLGADHPEAAWSHEDLADAWRGLSNYRKERTEVDAVLRIRQSRNRPGDPALIHALRTSARLEFSTGNYAAARVHMRQALEHDRSGSQWQTASDLDWLALIAGRQSDFDTQQAYLDLELRIRVAAGTWSSDGVANTLASLAECLIAQQSYDDARQTIAAALTIAQSCDEWQSPAVANVLRRIALLEARPSGDTICAEAMAVAASDIYRSTDTRQFVNEYFITSNQLANIYASRGDRDRAIATLQDVVSNAEIFYGPRTEQTAVYLHDLALQYSSANRLAEARMHYEAADDLCRELESLPDAVNTATQLAGVENKMAAELGDDQATEPARTALRNAAAGHLREALSRAGEAFDDPFHPELHGILRDLADTYEMLGQYQSALPVRQQALEIVERDPSSSIATKTFDLNRLAADEKELRLYGAAIDHLQLALNLDMPTKEASELVPDYSDLADVYSAVFDRVRQKEMLMQALDWSTTATRPTQASLLVDLSDAQDRLGQSSQAIESARRALDLSAAQSDEEIFRAAEVVLANALSDDSKTYNDAEALYRGALLDDEQRGVNDPPTDEYVTDLNNLAFFLEKTGRCEEAGARFEEAWAATLQLNPNQPDFTVHSNIAAFYAYIGDQARSIDAYRRLLHGVQDRVTNEYGYLTEQGRLRFQAAYASDIDHFLSVAIIPARADPALRAEILDVLLWHKGNVARSLAKARRAVLKTGGATRRAQLDQIRRDSVRLAGLVAQGRMSDPATVAQTKREIIDEEELLFRNLALPPPEHTTWKDVREHLEPDAAAVEIVRFDEYTSPSDAGESRYIAMIVTHTNEAPELVNLGTASFIDSKVLADYEALRNGTSGAGVLFAESIWKPIEQHIGGATRVYISGDGKLTSIAWNIIPSGEESLIDRYDLRVVPSIADVADTRDASGDRSAVLLGNIDFGPVRHTGSVRLSDLPGTRAEVDAVQSILTQKGWSVTTLEQGAATASAINALRSPRLLHIATHSFVQQANDARPDVNGLSETGLFLAGANGEPGDGEHLLTAAAARYLDLADTELVVLAACESGGGPVRSGEGVFGLPRSFIEAGASSVLMTLWRIPDRAAQQIMTTFYRYWSDGIERHEALRRAVLEAKRQKRAGLMHRNTPFYWGAFMFVGR